MSTHYKIAIISAYIGNGGKTGSLSFTDSAMKQLNEYGVDIYSFSNADLTILKSMSHPKSEVKINVEKYKRRLYGYYYRQKTYPNPTDNETRLLAKIPKILFYKLIPEKYDYYIWLDSKFTIEEHWLDYVLWLISNKNKFDIMTSIHSDRKSINDEFNFMWKLAKNNNLGVQQKYNLSEIALQRDEYRRNKWFDDDALYELTMIIYSNNILNKKEFCEEWYAHNVHFSIQDQISFPFLCKKHKIKVCPIFQYVFDMPFVIHEYGHSKQLYE